jgi:hypothetical protein
MQLRRPSPASVIAGLALFIALGGTAIAAHHYIITKTSQIKPDVLTTLKGNRGKAGVAGPEGIQGKEGAPGKEGVPGKEGAQGVPGTLSSAYLDAYLTSPTSVAANARVPFGTTVEPPVGIVASGGNTEFIPASTGTYLVTLTLTNGASKGFQLDVAGAPVGPLDSSTTLSLSRVVQVTAGSAISIVNPESSMSDSFPAGSEIAIVRIA